MALKIKFFDFHTNSPTLFTLLVPPLIKSYIRFNQGTLGFKSVFCLAQYRNAPYNLGQINGPFWYYLINLKILIVTENWPSG